MPKSSSILLQAYLRKQLKLRCTSEIRTAKQHRSARPISFQVGDTVMVQAPERHSKHSPKFASPYKITLVMGRNKYRVFDIDWNSYEIILALNILGLSLHNDLNWKFHISSLTKSASAKLGVLCRLRQHFSPSQMHAYNIQGPCPPLYRVCVSCMGGFHTHTALLNRVESKAFRLINSPPLTDSNVPLNLRRNVASLSIFYRYFQANCSSELANCQSWHLRHQLRHCVDDGTTISSTLIAMTLKLKKRRNDVGANTLSQIKFCVIFPLKPSSLCN